jgi:hypothetical protein
VVNNRTFLRDRSRLRRTTRRRSPSKP